MRSARATLNTYAHRAPADGVQRLSRWLLIGPTAVACSCCAGPAARFVGADNDSPSADSTLVRTHVDGAGGCSEGGETTDCGPFGG